MSWMSTILIVDDDPRYRSQVAALLAADGFTVVGLADDGASAIAAATALRPQYVLLDIGLPGESGIEVSRSLAGGVEPPLIVLTSSRDARAFGRRLREAPVLGFLPKEQVSGAAILALAADA
jgi:DNA-binding NarL/FixJ family response regulator